MDGQFIFTSIIIRIRELLEDQNYLNAFRFPNHFVRCRKLSMAMVIAFLFNSTKQKMDTNIDNLRDLDAFPDFPQKISKQAISKARHGIMPEFFKSLFDLSVEMFYKTLPVKKFWMDLYNVFAVDGSKFQLLVSRSNFAVFGEMFSSKNPNRRWSMSLVSTVYDVMNDFIPHALVMPYLGSERAAAIRHCEELEHLKILHGNSILVFDRGYYSEDMFRYFSSHGYKCVMRLKEGYKISQKSKGDIIDILHGDPDKGAEDIKIRVIMVELGNGTKEYLATNIFDTSLTRANFKELYFLRWPIEGKYKELKSQIGIEEFVGASSISVEQEIYISLLYSNLASLVKKQADEEIEANANPKNKYKYQANRAYIIGRIRPIAVNFLLHIWGEEKIGHLFGRAAQEKSQLQPGREQPRKKPKNERTHFNNRKTCFV